LRFIVVLPAHRDGLCGLANLDSQRAVRRCDAEVLVAEPSNEIERLLRRLLLGESQRIRGDL
jgi:hypothetical protein